MSRTLIPGFFIGCACTFALLCGCVAVNPDGDYSRARQAIMEATGTGSVFAPEDAGSVEAAVAERMKEGVTLEEAVEICLINNPALQAAFLDVGIARADIVQSGLLANPTLALSVAFPEGGGRSNIQATFAQSIVEIWQIPVRRRAASRALDAAILELTRQASQAAVDTKSAYLSAVAAEQILAIAQENHQLAQQLLDVAEDRQKAGAVGALDVNLVRGTLYFAELETQRARLDSSTVRRRLATLLGLTADVRQLVLASAPSPSPLVQLVGPRIAALALAYRLDIQAARQETEACRARLALEFRKIVPDVALGAYLERTERRALPGRNVAADAARSSVAAGSLTAPEIESRGQRESERDKEIDAILGPAISLTLPVFDQNQAQIAKAEFAYEQSLRRLDALERKVVQQVSQGVDQAETARRTADFFRDKLLPQAQSNLDLSRESYKAGRSSLIVLLDAQRVLLSTRRDAIAAQRDSAIALAELERLVSRPLSSIHEAPPAMPAADEVPPQSVEDSHESP